MQHTVIGDGGTLLIVSVVSRKGLLGKTCCKMVSCVSYVSYPNIYFPAIHHGISFYTFLIQHALFKKKLFKALQAITKYSLYLDLDYDDFDIFIVECFAYCRCIYKRVVKTCTILSVG